MKRGTAQFQRMKYLGRKTHVLFAGLLSLFLLGSPALAVDYVFDGTTDLTWEAANWNNGTAGQNAIESTGADIGVAPTGTSYDYLDDTFLIGNGSTVTSSQRVTLGNGSLTVNNSSQLDITATGNFSALNIGFGTGPTTVLFDGATVNLAGAGTSGRAVRVENNSTLTLQNSTLNVTSSGNNDSIEVEDTAMLFIVDSILNMGHLRLDEGSAGAEFSGGSLTVSSSNPLRSSNTFSGEFNWTGAAGSGTITHTNLSANNSNLAGKITQGFFSIEGTRIDPTISNTTDWSVASNVDALNAELESLIVNSKFFKLTSNGTEQVLSLEATTVIEWIDALGGNWSEVNNWSTDPVLPGATDDVLFSGVTFTEPQTINVDTNVVVNKLTVSGANRITFDDVAGETLDVNEFSVSGTHEVAAPLAGGATTKSGAGELVLTADNGSFSGDIAVTAGDLTVTADNSLGTGAVSLASGTFLNLQGDGLGTGYSGAFDSTLTGNGEVRIGEDATTETVTLDDAGMAGFDGIVAVRGGVTIADSSTDLGTTTGETWINFATGELQIDGSGGNVTLGDNFNVGSRATSDALINNTAGTNKITGNINGQGSGTYNLQVTGGSLQVGNTAVNPSVIRVGNDLTAPENQTGTFDFDVASGATFIVGDTNIQDAGRIVGDNVNVVKRGDGELIIATRPATASTDTSNASGISWGGTTTVEEGRMTILAGTGDSGEPFSDVTVQTGAVYDVSDFGTYNLGVGKSIGGGGTIDANDGGAFKNVGYFDDGFLVPGDSIGTLTVDGNLILSTFSTIATGAMVFELSSSNSTAGVDYDQVTVTNNLNLTQGATSNTFNLNLVVVDSQLATSGSYTLFEAAALSSGGVSSSAFNVNLVNPQGTVLETRYSPSVIISEATDTISVSASGSGPMNLTWAGGLTTWDIDLTSNWNSDTEHFFDLDSVTFDDTASNFAVLVSDTVTPANMVFNNSTNDYEFTGNNGIEGTGGVTLNGTGTVTLANTGNAFTGPSTINSGTLVLRDDQTGLTGSFDVNSGGTLQIGDATGEGNLGASAVNIAAGGTVDIFDDNGQLGQTFTGAGDIIARENVQINTDLSGFTGTITQTSGAFSLNATASGTMDPSSTIVVNGGNINVFPAGGQRVIDAQVSIIDGNIRVGNPGDSSLTFNGPITVTDTASTFRNDGDAGLRFGPTANISISAATNLTFQTGGTVDAGNGTVVEGNISGDGQITKTTSGELQLLGANTYTGNTTINSGTVVLGAAATLPNTPLIDIASGATLDTTAQASFTAASGQTLAGLGTAAGNYVAASGSTIQVGGNGIPVLDVLAGHWTFDVDGSDSASVPHDATLGASASVDNGVTPGQAAPLIGAGSLAFTDAADDDGNRVETIDYAGVTGDGARTYSFWFNSNLAQEGNATFIGAGTNGAGQRFDVKVAGGDQLRVEVEGNGMSYPDTDIATGTTGNWLDGNWHHIAVTLPEDGVLGDALLYLDGVLFADDGTSQSATVNTANENLYFGDSHNLATDRNFAGNLDDVQLYLTALDASDIATLYNSGSGGTTIAGSTLITSDVGTFTVDGDLTLQTGASLELDLASLSLFDKLSVTGALTAAGDLNIAYAGTTALADGDSFDVLDFASASGAFDNINLPALAGDLSWDTSNLLVDGTLAVIAGGVLEGDYDGDGQVGQGDLDVVLLNWGTSNFVLLPGNDPANEAALPYSPDPFDGSVDQNELDGVLLNWGSSLAAASATVPEPNTLVILGIAVGSVLISRKRLVV